MDYNGAAQYGVFYGAAMMQAPPPHAATPPSTTPNASTTPGANNTSGGKKKILAKRFKTELCQSSLYGRRCPYEARCMFAHGPEELRTAEQNLAEGLTSEEAIKEWKILNPPGSQMLRLAQQQHQQRTMLTAAWPTIPMAMMTSTGPAMPVRLPQAAPATPLPSFPGYTTVHPGQMVYLPSSDGTSLTPVSIASLCWPNGVPLLPLPSHPAPTAAAAPPPTVTVTSDAEATTVKVTAAAAKDVPPKSSTPSPSPVAASPHGAIGGVSLQQPNSLLTGDAPGPTLAASWDDYASAMLVGASFAHSAPVGGSSLIHLDSVLSEVRRRDKESEMTNT